MTNSINLHSYLIAENLARIIDAHFCCIKKNNKSVLTFADNVFDTLAHSVISGNTIQLKCGNRHLGLVDGCDPEVNEEARYSAAVLQ